MMSRQLRLTQLPLVGTILLGLLAGVYLFASARKRASKARPPATIVKHTVDTPAGDVLKYWTEDKMRNARPAKMPDVSNVKAPERGKKRSRRPPV